MCARYNSRESYMGRWYFLVGKNKYSKSYKFLDINYEVASREDKEAMFLGLFFSA